MSSRRPLILMGALLVLLFGFLFQVFLVPRLHANRLARPNAGPPLAGQNSISGLEVKEGDDGVWIAEFDYFYTGAPEAPILEIELAGPRSGLPVANEAGFRRTFVSLTERGAHHARTAIAYPGAESTTRQVAAVMRTQGRPPVTLARQQIEKTIDWPTFEAWTRNDDFSRNSPEKNLERAVTLIDTSSASQIEEAKQILERLLAHNPQLDPAYVELARIAMKTNWTAEGLRQAEKLLSSALQIRPNNVNAKILMGYVYAHQRRFKEAQGVFTDAAGANPPNLWLWANWGELLLIQGKDEQAIVKYRVAISRPMTHDTYDRAREDAYMHLLALLQQRKDMDGMEALYKQRLDEFGPSGCYGSDYARFLLQERGDTQSAIELAHRALNQQCRDSEPRKVLGLAQYVKWATTSGPKRQESLNEARIYLPEGPMPLYLLATSERTVGAAKQLVASGEPIDQLDNDKLTALAYALHAHDLAAAKRLLALGAKPEIPVGDTDIPLALLPVLERDVEAARMLQRVGVDYSKLRYQGETALHIARQMGDEKMIDLLAGKASSL